MNAQALLLSLLVFAGSALAAEPSKPSSETVALARLMAVNEHEIMAADLVATKRVSAPVAEYAAMLKREHTQNQTETAKLAAASAVGAEDSGAVAAQKAQAAAEREALSAQSDEAFEPAYLAAMVKDHEAALQMVDEELLPAATTPEVRTHLQKTREHLAMHLERAKALQAK